MVSILVDPFFLAGRRKKRKESSATPICALAIRRSCWVIAVRQRFQHSDHGAEGKGKGRTRPREGRGRGTVGVNVVCAVLPTREKKEMLPISRGGKRGGEEIIAAGSNMMRRRCGWSASRARWEEEKKNLAFILSRE